MKNCEKITKNCKAMENLKRNKEKKNIPLITAKRNVNKII